jgi:hypothetical protein
MKSKNNKKETNKEEVKKDILSRIGVRKKPWWKSWRIR